MGELIEGFYTHGQLNGKTRRIAADGNCCFGDFKDSYTHGFVTLIDKDGNLLQEGYFNYGSLYGECLIYDEDNLKDYEYKNEF